MTAGPRTTASSCVQEDPGFWSKDLPPHESASGPVCGPPHHGPCASMVEARSVCGRQGRREAPRQGNTQATGRRGESPPPAAATRNSCLGQSWLALWAPSGIGVRAGLVSPQASILSRLLGTLASSPAQQGLGRLPRTGPPKGKGADSKPCKVGAFQTHQALAWLSLSLRAHCTTWKDLTCGNIPHQLPELSPAHPAA